MPASKSALLTNVTHFAGPPALDALLKDGFAVACHDPAFGDADLRATFEAGHPGALALEAMAPEAIVGEALEKLGSVEVLVSNDSYPAIVRPVEGLDIEGLRATLDALVVMPYGLVGSVVPHFRDKGRGTVIMITSPRAKLPMPGGSIPDAAREAGNALLRSFAKELAPLNVSVNAIAPNYFANEMYFPKARFVDDAAGREFVERMVPAGRLGRPEELGELVSFLASTDARFMTGSTLEFTGGWPVSPPLPD